VIGVARGRARFAAALWLRLGSKSRPRGVWAHSRKAGQKPGPVDRSSDVPVAVKLARFVDALAVRGNALVVVERARDAGAGADDDHYAASAKSMSRSDASCSHAADHADLAADSADLAADADADHADHAADLADHAADHAADSADLAADLAADSAAEVGGDHADSGRPQVFPPISASWQRRTAVRAAMA
jgi:hypothetical protein